MVIARLGIVDQNGKFIVKYKYGAYCNNNPIMYVDSIGDFLTDILALSIDGGVNLVLVLRFSAGYQNAKELSKSLLKNGDVNKAFGVLL